MKRYGWINDATEHRRKFDGAGNFTTPGLYDKDTGDRLVTKRVGVCAPMVIKDDLPPHEGPSGRIITTRKQQREEFRVTGTRPYEPSVDGQRPRGFATERMAKRYGQKVSVDARDYLKEERAKVNKALTERADARRAIGM